MDETSCEHCGAKMVEYRHRLTKPLLLALRRLHEAGGGPINLKELNLTRNQWDNFQKLRYFGLVTPTYHDGTRARGVWQITAYGRDFVTDQASCPPIVWTYRGKAIRYEGTPISCASVIGYYTHREVWAAEAVPH